MAKQFTTNQAKDDVEAHSNTGEDINTDAEESEEICATSMATNSCVGAVVVVMY